MDNEQAKGYFLMTLNDMKISKEQKDIFFENLHWNFDNFTEEEARQYYRKN